MLLSYMRISIATSNLNSTICYCCFQSYDPDLVPFLSYSTRLKISLAPMFMPMFCCTSSPKDHQLWTISSNCLSRGSGVNMSGSSRLKFDAWNLEWDLRLAPQHLQIFTPNRTLKNNSHNGHFQPFLVSMICCLKWMCRFSWMDIYSIYTFLMFKL